MPSHINDVLIQIRVENGTASAAELDRIAGSVERLESRMVEASKSVDLAGESFDKSGKRGRGMRDMLGQIRGAAKLGGAALVQMGMQGVAAGLKYNATMAAAKTSFTGLLGSADRAGKLTDRLGAASSKSPLPLENYLNSAKSLVGFGVAARDVVPYLKSVNKAAVATGQGGPGMEKIAAALGQIKAKGKLTSDGLRQLREAGVPANKLLQKEFGLTARQMRNIGGEGIKADRAIKAITGGWEKQFGPAYRNASKTFGFQWEAAKKQLNKFLGEGLQPVIDFLAQTALPAGRRFLAWLNKLPNATKSLVLGGAVVAGLAIFSGGLALVVGGIIAVVYVAVKYRKQITAFVGAIAGWISGAARSVASWLSTAAKNVKGFIGDLLPVRAAVAVLRVAIRVLRPVVTTVFKAIREHVKFLVAAFKIHFNAMKIYIRTAFQVIRRLGAIVGNVVAIVSNLLRGDWRGAWNAARRLVSNAFGIIRAVARGAMTFLKTIPKQILGLFRGLPGRVSAVTSGLFDGIKTAFGGVVNWLIDVWNGLEFSIGGVTISILGKDINVPKVTIGTPDIPKIGGGGPSPGGTVGGRGKTQSYLARVEPQPTADVIDPLLNKAGSTVNPGGTDSRPLRVSVNVNSTEIANAVFEDLADRLALQ